MNENTQRITTAKIKEYRETLLDLQDGACPICERTIDKAHLDHSHTNEPYAGHIRMVLCSLCNPTLGVVFKSIRDNGLRLEPEDITRWLENAVDYMNTDFSQQPIHPNHIPDLVKRFKRMPKGMQVQELIEEGQGIEEVLKKLTQKQLTDKYKAYLKEKYSL